jgi:adenine/guanine/hypoxanthine permease
VAFTLVATNHLTWPQAMGVIVVEGLAISVLVLTGLREMILNAIPMDLKKAIGIGIGLFITLIGLVNAGIVIPGEGTVVTLTPDFTTWPILTFLVGLAFTGALVARRFKGALLVGIVGTTIFATIVNELNGLKLWSKGIAAFPQDWFASPDFHLVGHFSFSFFSALGLGAAIATILAVMLSDFFDTMGTVVGIGGEAGLLDRDGRLPGVNRVLLVDSLAAAAGGAASASSNTTFIESASGVAEGGRTGLASVIVGILFLAAIFIAPIAGVIPPEATAPVLVIVGYFMLTLIRGIDLDDPGMGIPVLLTIVMMPFTYSITNGVGAGFVSYTVIQLLRGRWREVHPLMFLVAAIFGWYFFHGVVG